MPYYHSRLLSTCYCSHITSQLPGRPVLQKVFWTRRWSVLEVHWAELGDGQLRIKRLLDPADDSCKVNKWTVFKDTSILLPICSGSNNTFELTTEWCRPKSCMTRITGGCGLSNCPEAVQQSSPTSINVNAGK